VADERERRLEAQALAGDNEARVQLGNIRMRALQCPWCGKGREDAIFQVMAESDEAGGKNLCCCHTCWEGEVKQSKRKDYYCDDCPNKELVKTSD
jgi:hypothetical protein